jgi:hypothetical protein
LEEFEIAWRMTDRETDFSDTFRPDRIREAGRGDRKYLIEDLDVDAVYLVAVRAVHDDPGRTARHSEWVY